MTTDERTATTRQSVQRFTESFDDFCVGLVDLEHMRALAAELLGSEPQAAEALLIVIDTALREGLIKASTYEVLTTDIDRATSEDEPTEWSEETRAQIERGEAVVHDDESGEETKHPAGPSDTSAPAGAHIETGPGTVLKNRFELVAHIGAGSMADVYEAIDLRKQEAGLAEPRLAVKVISSAFPAHAAALETLQREALNSLRLTHPNIIQVFDFDRDGDRYFMTMELLEGRSLVDILRAQRARPLPFDRAASIVTGLCKGLEHAHRQGIVHADIKPGNIFVTTSGQVKILDFGIARSPGIEASDSPVTGAHTPAYASCEVLEGAEPTEQDDLFAMACVTYRMLAGFRVFGHLTALDAEGEQVEPQRIETLHPQQWQALQRALAYRRTDRTQRVSRFATGFCHQPPQNEPDEPESPGLPLRYGIAAMAVLLVVITLALFWPEPARMPVGTAKTLTPAPSMKTTGIPEPVEPVATPTNPEKTASPEPETSRPPDPEPADSKAASAQTAPQPEPPPARTRIDELEALADRAMDDGHLLDPAEDSASRYIEELAGLAPGSSAVEHRRTRLSELMLLEAMVAITDENFDVATRWITQARALGASEETTQRFEEELQKARAAKRARQTETLGAIFASATPAAILAEPADDYGEETRSATIPAFGTAETEPAIAPGSLSLAMVVPDAMANIATDTEKENPAGQSADLSDRDIPLSDLKFRHFVKPRPPRGWRGHGVSGWIDMRFRITPEGKTDNITVIAAEPDDRFEQPAITAISKWRFKPVYVDGVASEKYSAVRLRFELD